MASDILEIKRLGWEPQPYRPIWRAMTDLTQNRSEQTNDQLWLLNHAPVFTQGKNGRAEHLLAPGDIQVIPIDRGGQVTYHGPGQLMAYVMLDLNRLGLGIRSLVEVLENTMIATLDDYRIAAVGDSKAPGVYVEGAKIGSIGLRVTRGMTYHGLALNVDMDLSPFSRIDPCGFHGLRMTQIRDFAGPVSLEDVSEKLSSHLRQQLSERKKGTLQPRLIC